MKRAIVTGTSRGIGAAVARALLARDWHVLGLARGAPEAELAHENYAHRALDLADLDALRALFEGEVAALLEREAPERVGLVNNAAALAPVGPLYELDPQALARAFAVNVVAPTWLIGFVLRAAPAAAALRVVDLSSGAATSADPGWTAYCATKAALRMVGQVVALERAELAGLSERDLALVEYAPHVVATRMQEELRAADPKGFPRHQRFVELHERGELVAPEGPAQEIADLLEDDDLPVWQERRFQP